MDRKLLLVVGALAVAAILIGIFFLSAGETPEITRPDTTRQETIPLEAVKVTPSMDQHPPILHSSLWYQPIPVPGPVNTAGAEDSAFVLPDGSALYFFFTPDVRKTPQEQLMDEVSGIWCSVWNGSGWGEPYRVWLQDPGKLALDGAAFVSGDVMWFASAREGYTGVNLFTSKLVNGEWAQWDYAGDELNEEYGAGEMHITADGKRMYFHSERPGGMGGLDIWYTDNLQGEWQTPVNVIAVNTAGNEGWPFISQDGNEMWLTRTYLGSPALFRSLIVGGNWTEPELVISSFAGEPTLDQEGNLYFVHHYFKDGIMIEADIYVAYRK